jgi:hypothetical protein
VRVLRGQATNYLAHPRRKHRHRDKCDWPCRHETLEPLHHEPGTDPLGSDEDEGRHDGDHDDREKTTEEDRCKTSVNTHCILLWKVIEQLSVTAETGL